MNDKRIKRSAMAASLLFIAIFLISILFFVLHSTDKNYKSIANVFQDGKLIKKISLNKEETKTYRIDTENGNFNILEVRKGCVSVIDADCPDKLCEKIECNSSKSLPIVCLPNRLVVEIVEEKQSNNDSMDAIAY